MYRIRELFARLAGYRVRARRDRDLDREIRAHLQMAIEEHLRAGMSPPDARASAMRELGGVTQTKEAFREQQGFAAVENVVRDLSYACRLLRARPSFSAAVMLAIALGVGANTAVFSVAHSVLWRPLPFDEPDHLLRLFQTRTHDARMPVSPLNYLDWAKLSSSLDGTAAWRGWTYELAGSEGKESIPGARVTASLFGVLGVQPSLGRTFLEEEDSPVGPAAAVISDAFWRSRFGANPDVIGRTLVAGDTVHTIVGVLPPGVTFPAHDTAIWTPLRIGDGTHRMRRTENYLNVIARRKRGVGLPRVQEDLDRLGRLLAAEYPAANAGGGIAAVPLHDFVTGQARKPLLLLVFVAAAVLLISCANVAHLLLARTISRNGELTLRAALGATRGRLLRQNFTESVLLALGGGALGAVAAMGVIEALRPSLPAALPRRHEITVDAAVLGYGLLCTVVVCAVAAAAPAVRAWRASLNDTLKASRQTSTPRATLLGRAAVVVQITLSLILLVGTMLMLRSLHNVLTADSGFVADNVLVTSISLPVNYFSPAGVFQAGRVVEHFEGLVAQVGQLRGVEAVGLVNHLPLSDDASGTRFTIEGRFTRPEDVPSASYRVVSPSYFATLRARLLRGRYFSASDRPDSTPVFLINESMARRYWPGRDPVGSRVRRGGTDSKMPLTTVVGVVADMKQDGLDRDAQPEIFIPHTQFPWPAMSLVVRSSRAIGDFAPELRATLSRINGTQSVQALRPFQEVIWNTVNARAFTSNLLAISTALALIVAILGVYAVTAHATAGQTKEIAIRIALGAPRSAILHAAVGGTVRLVCLALALGAAGAYGAARVMSSALFGIAPFDPLTYAVAATALGAIATLAAAGPARRALQTDPLVSLRAG
jgi:putative ABC transport system permease protein